MVDSESLQCYEQTVGAKGEFWPNLDILPASQRRLWDELAAVPEEFVLYGGTAIALYLGHRQSVDFDFFGRAPFDPSKLRAQIPFLINAQVTQVEPNTLTCIVDRDGPVKVSFFGVPAIVAIAPVHRASDTGVKVASLLDLAGAKASVVQLRAEAKDYIDIDAIISATEIDLPRMLAAAAAIHGDQFNPQITLKALSYFDDGNLGLLPDAMKARLAAAARNVDLDHLPAIQGPR